jgi:hypothetical protein
MDERTKTIAINKLDVAYRDIPNCDDQFTVMKFILNCLSDQQLQETKKLISSFNKGGN